MLDLLNRYLTETWHLFAEAAPYVLFGFLAAGVIKALLSEAFVARHLGGRSLTAVLKASLFGIPLPLCSCGVIPAAIGLRKQGAGRGPSAAFLVSTPESGVDSIAITWALLDPFMTIIRPVAAFLTATVTGLLINGLPEDQNERHEAPLAKDDDPNGCGSSGPDGTSLRQRIVAGIDYAFGDLLRDIGGWLLLGVLIAGVISTAVPADFFSSVFADSSASLVVMLLVGIPLYICASASTPIAAVLILKGLSPGAALVFLLAGPATNVATLTVIARFWGRRTTVVYLFVIAVSSLLLGWLVNVFYVWAELDIRAWVTEPASDTTGVWGALAGVSLLVLIGRAFWRSWSAANCCDP